MTFWPRATDLSYRTTGTCIPNEHEAIKCGADKWLDCSTAPLDICKWLFLQGCNYSGHSVRHDRAAGPRIDFFGLLAA